MARQDAATQDGRRDGGGWRPGLRGHLVALAVALLLPALGLGVLASWYAISNARLAYEERLQDTARALSLAVDRELGRFEATLIGLATSRQLDDDATDADRADFHARAQAIATALGTRIIVTGPGPEYRQRINTALPIGAALPAGLVLPAPTAPLPRVFATGRTAIGGVAKRDWSTTPRAVVVTPVVRHGVVTAAVSMPLDPSRLLALLQAQGFSASTHATVTDDRMRVAARSRDHDRFVGQEMPDWYARAIAEQPNGFVRGTSFDGTDVVAAHAAVAAAPGWTVGVVEPWRSYAETWQRPLRILAGGGFVLVALGVLLAAQVARRLLGPLSMLAEDARTVAGDAEAPAVLATAPFRIAEFEALRRGFAAAAAALQARLVRERQAASAARASEAALAESEARFNRAVAAARIGTWEWEAATNRLTGSPGREALYGLPTGTLPTREAFLERIHPEDRAEAAQAGARAIAGVDGGAYLTEFRVIWPDGSLRWLRSEGRVDFDGDGRPLRMSGAVMDVTARREAQDAFERLNQELAARVQEEIARREAAQLRAVQAERIQALGQLAGGIAHDFNNVLQAVQGGAALIERRPGEADNVRRFARLILESSSRGAAVTRRLLAFARQGDLRAEPVAPAALLQSLREILSHTLGSTIELAVEADPALPALFADKAQLETVLVNLATNARDAMPKGGRITFGAARDCVREDHEHPARLTPGRYLRLTVADTGTGIDEATRGRIYEPFFTTKPAGQGTGLGLPMAKGFAEQSGGALLVASKLGQGTIVTLWLPAADAAAEDPDEAPPVPPDEVDDRAATTILLVDDDALVRESLAAELRAGGHAVLLAAGGEPALALLDAGARPDVLISDLSMPGMDGLAVIAAVQQRRPGIPAVLLTGYAGDGAALAVSGAITGQFSLLRKPVTGPHLLDRIAVLLAQPVG